MAPVFSLAPAYAADPSDAGAAAAAHLRDGYENRLYLDPVFKGSHPSDVVNDLAKQSIELPVHDGGLNTIGTAVDLLGVNYYNPLVGGAGVSTSANIRQPRRLGSRSTPPGSATFWCRQGKVAAMY